MLWWMRLLLIRHGQTIDNVRGVLGAVIPGPGLTELGREQAEAVPAGLESEEIEAVYVSAMVRTQETAGPLARARSLDINVIDGIHEILAGDLEQRSDKEAIQRYVSTVISWRRDLTSHIPGGESGTEFFDRFDTAINRISSIHRGTVAVVSHGAAIRTWASTRSRNLDVEFNFTHSLSNTAVVVMEGSPHEGWFATRWADMPIGGAELADASAPDPTGEKY